MNVQIGKGDALRFDQVEQGGNRAGDVVGLNPHQFAFRCERLDSGQVFARFDGEWSGDRDGGQAPKLGNQGAGGIQGKEFAVIDDGNTMA